MFPFAEKVCRTWNLFNKIVHINYVYCRRTNNEPIIILNGIDGEEAHFCFQIVQCTLFTSSTALVVKVWFNYSISYWMASSNNVIFQFKKKHLLANNFCDISIFFFRCNFYLQDINYLWNYFSCINIHNFILANVFMFLLNSQNSRTFSDTTKINRIKWLWHFIDNIAGIRWKCLEKCFNSFLFSLNFFGRRLNIPSQM